jgi:DNA-binding SARP family transcriptional activator
MLRSYLFGQLLLANDSVPLPRLATQKASSLLGYLLMSADHLYTREYLGELFWPNRPSDNARRSLNTALWQIRQMLKQGGFDPARFLEASGTTVRWSPTETAWLDVAEFESASHAAATESLERAVSLYRGPFLEGLYDNWCIEERYRLEEEYLEALSRLAQLYRSEREFSQALDCARRILEIDPLREDACRAAMEALFQLGQRSAALERYEVCARALKQDLNAEPSQETRDLYSAILDESLPRVVLRTRSPEPSSAAALSVPSTFTNLPLFDAGRVPFAGRVEELRRLRTWWGGGREPLALITGEAGVGKTRLTQELAAALRWSGAQVGWGRCYAFERALPYQSLAEALRGLFAETPSATFEALPPWVTAELVRLLPELAGRLTSESASPATTADQTNLFEAVSHALAHLGQHQPLLIVLDRKSVV